MSSIMSSFISAGNEYQQKMSEQQRAAQMWSCNRMKVAEEILYNDVNLMNKVEKVSLLIHVPVKAIIWTLCFVGKYPNLTRETIVAAGRFHCDTVQEWADMVENMCDNDNPEIHRMLPLEMFNHPNKGLRLRLNPAFWRYPDSLAKKMANCHFPEPVLEGSLHYVRYNYENAWGVTGSREGSMLGKCRHELDICLDTIRWENEVAYRVTDKWADMPIIFKNNEIKTDSEGKQYLAVIPSEKMDEDDVLNVKFTQEAYREMARSLMHKYNGHIIHLPKAVDYRGRVYSRGYYMNDQGIDHAKASLTFAHGQIVEQGGLPNMSFSDGRAIEFLSDEDWVWFEFANQMGLDKLSARDRINWAKMMVYSADIIQELMDYIASGELEADNPCQALAALDQIADMMEGIPCVWGVSQDGCASGLQLASAMLLDKRLAEITNIYQEKRLDTYTELFKPVQECLSAIGKTYTRTQLKKGFMPFTYASDKSLKDLFGSDVTLVTQCLEREVPSLMSWHDLPQDLWQNVDEYRWTMPDGFRVVMPVFRQDIEQVTFFGETLDIPVNVKGGKDKGKALGPNWIHSFDALVRRELVRAAHLGSKLCFLYEMAEYCILTDKPVFKKGKNKNQVKLNQLLALGYKTGFYSLRILEYINSPKQAEQVPFNVMMKLLSLISPEPFEVISIHDCFRVLPKYANFVKWFYLEMMAKLAESEALCLVIRQTIKDPRFILGVFSPDRQEFAENIRMKGNYAVC